MPCVGAMVEHNSAAIARKCEVTLLDDEEMVVQIASTHFAIYSPVMYNASTKCLHNKHISFLISQTLG